MNEHGISSGGQPPLPYLLFGPDADSVLQPVRVKKPAHKAHLIEANRKEEPAEVCQRLVTQVAAAIEIASSGLISGLEMRFVSFDVSSKSSGERPKLGANATGTQHGVGHEPSHAAITIKKRVDPEQAMMGGSNQHNAFGNRSVGIGKSVHELRHEIWNAIGVGSNVPADFYVMVAVFAGNDLAPFSRNGISDEEQVRRQAFAEIAMKPADELFRHDGCWRLLAIDEPLDLYVRTRFELEVPLFRCLVVDASKSPFDIDGMRVMPLNQVRIVAVHGPYELAELDCQRRSLRGSKSGRLYGQRHRKIGKLRRPSPRQDRFKGSELDQDCRFRCRYYH